MAHLARVEAEQRATGGGGTEHRPEAVRGMPILAEFVRVQRHREARGQVVAHRDRTQQGAAGHAVAFADRQRRRHDAAARVGERRRMRVVGLVGMGQHAIGQRRVDRRGDDRGADHAGFWLAAERIHERDRALARQQPRAGHHRGQRVEQVMLGLLHHRGWQCLARRGGEVGSQRGHHRRDHRTLLPFCTCAAHGNHPPPLMCIVCPVR